MLRLYTVLFRLIFLAGKLGVLALGCWLVYLGFMDLRGHTDDIWTLSKFLGGALLMYVVFKFRIHVSASTTDTTD